MVTLYTEKGEAHGLIKEVANSVPDKGFDRFDEKHRAKMKKLKDHDSKKVRARYINYISHNERLEKPYAKWAGDKIQMWKLIPGYEYILPQGFVDEVNESQGLANRSEKLDENDKIQSRDGKPQKIHEIIVLGPAVNEHSPAS